MSPVFMGKKRPYDEEQVARTSALFATFKDYRNYGHDRQIA